MLVSKWMENGTAFEYVKKHPTADVFQLVQGIAHGLEYLHDSNVVHSDIKSVCDPGKSVPCYNNINIYKDNVLVSDAGIPQICDFGLSRLTAASLHQTTTDSLRGSIRWLSFEFLNGGEYQNKHTKETDVWAFGMTIYVSIRRPYRLLMTIYPILTFRINRNY